jgi:hypothetical protein
LCEDDCPCALGVFLGTLSNFLSDLLDVLGVDVVGFSECGGFGLVADEDVDVG